MSDNPLGEQVPLPSKYDPSILYPIPRWPARSLLDIDKKLRMHGFDHWHAYEISWLDESGRPRVATGEFYFDVDSENIVESKSLKLYLNSLHQQQFESSSALAEIIKNDLSAVSRSEVTVELKALGEEDVGLAIPDSARSLDSESITAVPKQPGAELLQLDKDSVFDEELRSDLFKSNCPVTGQPDWASVYFQYTGNKINRAALLAYLCAYREHQAYHEECAERIFRDISQVAQPAELFLAMNYLRRGGLDINVYRSSSPISTDRVLARTSRQ